MISFDDARNTILSTVQPLEATSVSIRDALGRVAAETIAADADAVPFPRSAIDGYAVRAAECRPVFPAFGQQVSSHLFA
jgi:molybdopterin molybdotransferase